MRIVCVLILLLSCFAVSSQSEEDTGSGNFMIVSCQLAISNTAQTNFEFWRQGLCSGSVSGIMFASPTVCHRPGWTIGQGMRVVEKYLQDHPERLHLNANQLINDALTQAFPCSPEKQGTPKAE